MADSVASSAISQRGWVVPSLAVIALAVVGLGYYSIVQISQLNQQVAALATQNGELSKTFGDAPQKLDDLSKRLSSIETPIASLDRRLSSLEQAPLAPITDLSGITADLGTLKTDLAALKTQIGDIAPSQLAALKTQIDQVSASIPAPADTSQLATQVAALDGELQALQAQLSTTTSAPPAPSAPTDLTTLQSDVNDLKSKVAAIDLGPLRGSLGEVKAQVDTLNTQVAQLPARTDLAALQTRLDEIANRPPPAVPAVVDIAPLQADIGDLKTRVAAVETSGKADAGTVAALKTELDGLTGRVGAIETAGPSPEVATLQTSLGELKQEITALAAGSDLKALQAAVADLQNRPRVSAVKPTLLTQIYFDRGSFKLGDAELAKLTSLAAQLRDKPREVAVMGFSDTQGPAEFNRALSLKRASAVRKALLGDGIGTSLITSISGLGEDGPPMDTKDNAPEQANRTVMIFANE